MTAAVKEAEELLSRWCDPQGEGAGSNAADAATRAALRRC